VPTYDDDALADALAEQLRTLASSASGSGGDDAAAGAGPEGPEDEQDPAQQDRPPLTRRERREREERARQQAAAAEGGQPAEDAEDAEDARLASVPPAVPVAPKPARPRSAQPAQDAADTGELPASGFDAGAFVIAHEQEAEPPTIAMPLAPSPAAGEPDTTAGPIPIVREAQGPQDADAADDTAELGIETLFADALEPEPEPDPEPEAAVAPEAREPEPPTMIHPRVPAEAGPVPGPAAPEAATAPEAREPEARAPREAAAEPAQGGSGDLAGPSVPGGAAGEQGAPGGILGGEVPLPSRPAPTPETLSFEQILLGGDAPSNPGAPGTPGPDEGPPDGPRRRGAEGA